MLTSPPWAAISRSSGLAAGCYKAIPIQTKREALRKFYLFEQSWQETKTEPVDWNHYPDLLAFLESL